MRKLLVLCLAMLIMVGGLAGAAGGAPPGVGVRWSPCHRADGPFECATVQVPLDYDQPGGATISLAVIRLRATDPSRRIGSLFVNPGGPGGSGVDLVHFAGQSFPPELLERFDLVGFDPRGVARSTPLRCFGSLRQVLSVFQPYPFPITDAEEAAWIETERRFVGACDQRDPKIAGHMSTANAARDLDQLRQAVGDAQLTYYGVSYGSYLGTTYANMFPGRVRAVGIDSVLDPIAWANEGGTLPFSSRLRSDQSALETLHEFFRLCDAGGPACSFAGSAAARYEALAQRLRSAPLPLTTPEGDSILYSYQYLVADSLGAMYSNDAWPFFAELLSFLESQASAASLGAARAQFQARLEYGTKRGWPRPTFLEGLSVACLDTDGPRNYSAWPVAADAAEAQFGHFGRIWTWISSVCAEWPFRDDDRYSGPFTAATANPVLVVANRYDPATAYEGAVVVDRLLPNSSLLTVAGWGHGVIGTSRCADRAIIDYLVDKVTPAVGTVCQPDVVPFTGPPPRP